MSMEVPAVPTPGVAAASEPASPSASAPAPGQEALLAGSSGAAESRVGLPLACALGLALLLAAL
jgi:hypothetical protein